MKVKVSTRRSVAAVDKEKSAWSVLRILIMVALTTIVSYVVTINYLSPSPREVVMKWASDHGYGVFLKDIGRKEAVMMAPVNLLRPVDIPKMVIDVKFKHMGKLNQQRYRAMKKGILLQGDSDFVPASIRYDDKNIKVKLRLKGDWTDHLEGNKWSFRIHVKGKKQLFGMRRFSIQHPRTRGYQGEVLVNETLRHMGVIAPRYFFVDVVLNGDSIGIMAVEEHSSKELLEANGRRESVIIRFDESQFWAAIAGPYKDENSAFNSFRNAQIDAFGSSRIAKSTTLSSLYATATGLLRSFVEGKLPASDVFDVELMGRFLAVEELWGAHHALIWHNQRYYLNPITLKLEPIGFDASPQSQAAIGTEKIHNRPIVAALLKDPEIYSAYKAAIKQLAAEILDGSLLDMLKASERRYLPILQSEFFLLQHVDYDDLEARARHVLATISEEAVVVPAARFKQYPRLIQAYIITDDKGSYLEVANAVPHEVEINSVQWVPKATNTPPVEFRAISTTDLPMHLLPTMPLALPDFRRIYYQPLATSDSYSLQIQANILGQKQDYTTVAQPYHAPLLQHPIPKSTLSEQLSRHPFLFLEDNEVHLYVTEGRWQVNGSLIIPGGYSLIVPAGTTLQFDAASGMVVNDSLRIDGTAEKPVILEGIPIEGNPGTWQGIAVLNAGNDSHISYATIRNTTGIDLPPWKLTGGTTFYQSNVDIGHTTFEGNRGEDALNIVSAKFFLKDIRILDTASDGFDADFTEGEIVGGVFQHIGKAGGGDAVDISGSTVKITGTRFEDVDDKALSVGEGSNMTASHLFIEGVGTGAASKDGSSLKLSESTIKNVRTAGLMAYIKKPEYGPGQIAAQDLAFEGVRVQARAQKNSVITIDGAPVPTEDVDVAELYSTVMKKGLQ
ncbi:MAG: CotH kinase family protein [Gammaproteobacteria bacterium]|nr:CotH kinase family protein [Gammaproteobacteria bacterium]